MDLFLISIIFAVLVSGLSGNRVYYSRIASALKRAIGEVINTKLGLLSVAVNFSIVYWVNHEYGLIAAGLAASKDGLSKFLVGGFFGRITERFSEIRSPFLAYPLGAFVPTVMAYTLFFIMHATTGTPLPLQSTIYPMMLSMFVNTPTTIFVLRRGYLRQNQRKPAVKDRVWEKRQERKRAKLAAIEAEPEIATLRQDLQ